MRGGADKCLLGLSATPLRKDGLTEILHHFLGPTAFRLERPPAQGAVLVHEVELDRDLSVAASGTRATFADVVTALAAHAPRNRVVACEVAKWARAGRAVLVLSDRRRHLEELCRLLRSSWGLESCALYLGGMTAAELAQSAQRQVLCSTYAMTAEGFDLPHLDTLVLATPRSDVEQAIGRIMRSSGDEAGDASIPVRVVSDFVDAALAPMATKRRQLYDQSGFKISRCRRDGSDRDAGGGCGLCSAGWPLGHGASSPVPLQMSRHFTTAEGARAADMAAMPGQPFFRRRKRPREPEPELAATELEELEEGGQLDELEEEGTTHTSPSADLAEFLSAS